MSRSERLKKLKGIISGYRNFAVAFSGGVDSTFLLAAAVRVLGADHVTAMTVVPPYVAGWEIEESREYAESLGVHHILMKAEMIDEVRRNPENRCYVCKRFLFEQMKDRCDREGIAVLADGSNADDLGDYRPGMQALRELSILSPMLKAGLTKQDIRDISREWELPTWDKPPYACLLTRIPHNRTVTPEILERIEKSEVILIEAGFPYVRVRDHGDVARIEIPRERFEEFLNRGVYETAEQKLKSCGYQYVTLDLGGYKMGNMNPAGVMIKREP